MKGAIAAGHPLTAEAGAQVLAEGGNAVDACLAAAFVSWVAESPLTGPASGGFLLVHRRRKSQSRLLDFFVVLPGAGLRREPQTEMEAVDVDFDGSSRQVFRVGAASVAVPGAVAGFEAAHRAYGSVAWPRLVEPAIRHAREGVELTRQQAYLHAILDILLRRAPEGQAIYGPHGSRLVAGDRLVMTDLARTLEEIAEAGAAAVHAGPLGKAIVDEIREHGGSLTHEDLKRYRVIWRQPVEAPFAGHRFLSNPPPSSGGVLLAYGLRILDRAGLGGGAGSAGAIGRLVEVMREQTLARGSGFGRDLFRGGLDRKLSTDARIEAAVARLEDELARAVREPREPARTTHISVVDGDGNAASMTASTGSGSGVVVPGTGIHLNNMLGEYDLNPAGRRRTPGSRLTSMMSPSLVLLDDRPRLVVGSAGSVRLRGAILQIVVNVLGHGIPVEEAIGRSRVHLDDGHVHCEGGFDPAELDELESRGYDVVRWRRRNLFFGGAAAVEVLPDGMLAAAGDPRRGGHGIVVGE
ncbi:MAG: gamma-glutamyltransferase [Actinobacteria bacterium]|nr:gamma-glutamyltransferase [Actinomycetota bacterium]